MTSIVGVIGLGAMGGGMARSLRRRGSQVHVFDVRADVAQAFADEGGVACASPAQLAKQCGVIVSVVVNAAQTESVLFGEGGCAAAMKRGSVFIMCSTVDPNWSMALESRLAALGIPIRGDWDECDHNLCAQPLHSVPHDRGKPSGRAGQAS